ncbi:MAG: hypothetical protein CNE95_00560 [Puniceicoccaceae bacterium MED-G30]|nr:MAG: hypothetical protein CNE95_00560 [Puniceicoccaceae bacterium MED-G30]
MLLPKYIVSIWKRIYRVPDRLVLFLQLQLAGCFLPFAGAQELPYLIDIYDATDSDTSKNTTAADFSAAGVRGLNGSEPVIFIDGSPLSAVLESDNNEVRMRFRSDDTSEYVGGYRAMALSAELSTDLDFAPDLMLDYINNNNNSIFVSIEKLNLEPNAWYTLYLFGSVASTSLRSSQFTPVNNDRVTFAAISPVKEYLSVHFQTGARWDPESDSIDFIWEEGDGPSAQFNGLAIASAYSVLIDFYDSNRWNSSTDTTAVDFSNVGVTGLNGTEFVDFVDGSDKTILENNGVVGNVSLEADDGAPVLTFASEYTTYPGGFRSFALSNSFAQNLQHSPDLMRDYLNNSNTPITVSISNLDLSPRTRYTLYLFGNVEPVYDRDSQFTPIDGDVTFASVTSGTESLVVDFTTGSTWDSQTSSVKFLWGKATGASAGQFNGLAITPQQIANEPYSGIQNLVTESNGKLSYSGYANIGQTNAVNTVPDFSTVGYREGGVSIPFVPAVLTLSDNGSGDDTNRIQSAIDQIENRTPDENGHRGALYLEAGDYTVSRTLTINRSGIVIRGAGSQEAGGTRITYTSTSKSNLFEVSGSGSPQRRGSTFLIVDDYVPTGAKSFHIEDTSTLSPGDTMIIEVTPNESWLQDIFHLDADEDYETPDGKYYGWSASGYTQRFRRKIESIVGNLVTVESPIVMPVASFHGGGRVYEYTFNGAIEEIGFEGIRLESSFTTTSGDLVGDDFDPNDASLDEHGWSGINMRSVRNSWVRQVTGKYFGYGLISIQNNSQYITVEDCAMLDHKSRIIGGNRYSFNIDDSCHLLFQRCLTRSGRHDYVSGSQTPGPNVFVDCLATDARSDVGPHHRWATGQLYDNVRTDNDINAQNATTSGSGHGWRGAQIMFWNCRADDMICDAPRSGMNWSVGNTYNVRRKSTQSEEAYGIWYSANLSVSPRSLYYAQLEDRLGEDVLSRMTLPLQRTGSIWRQLYSWDGEGHFADRVIAWIDAGTRKGNRISLQAAVRDLSMLQNGITSIEWRKVSGPGAVVFSDTGALQTQAALGEPGDYVFEVSVQSGEQTAVARVNLSDPTTSGEKVSAFHAWTRFFTGLGSQVRFIDDPDLDGLNNLAEYALGRHPTERDTDTSFLAQSKLAMEDAEYLEISYMRRRDYGQRGLNYRVESGLQIDSLLESLPVFTTEIESDDFEVVKHRLPIIDDAGFARLRIEFN